MARYGITFGVFFLYACMLQGTFLSRIFAVMVASFSDLIFLAFFLWAFTLITNAEPSTVYDSPAFRLGGAVSLILLGAIVKSWATQRKQHIMLSSFQWLLLLIFPLAALILMCFLYIVTTNAQSFSFAALVATILLLVVYLAQFVLMGLLSRQNAELEQKHLLQQQILLEEEKAAALQLSYAAQRRMTHEFTNHLEGVRALLQSGKNEEANEYIATLLPRIYTGTAVVNTHNPLVDAILNEKYAQAEKQGTLINFYLDNLEKIPLSEQDFVVVLSNLLNNALEASQHEQNGLIEIKMRHQDENFILVVRNKVTTPVGFLPSGLPKSTKAGALHGYGLKNVVAIMERAKAQYSFCCENNWFQFVALFSQ